MGNLYLCFDAKHVTAVYTSLIIFWNHSINFPVPQHEMHKRTDLTQTEKPPTAVQ